MTKKKSKQHPNQPNAAILSDTVDTATVPTTVIIAGQPSSTAQDDVHTPASTRLSFFNFITMATTEDIKKFLKLASTTAEGKNLGNLWRRAHGEGYEKGRKSLLQDLEKKMEEKFEEGVEKGKDLGREEGYSVAKEAFDEIISVVKAREATKVDTSDAGTQTNPTRLATTPQAWKFVENGVGTCFAPTIDFSVQTSSCVVHTPPTATSAAQTEPNIPLYRENDSAGPIIIEKAKISTINANTSENSQKITVFSLPIPSATVPNPSMSSNTTTALEMQPMLANLIQNHQKCEKSPSLSQTTSIFAKNMNELQRSVQHTAYYPNRARRTPSTRKHVNQYQ
jgi:hypothetical protein